MVVEVLVEVELIELLVELVEVVVLTVVEVELEVLLKLVDREVLWLVEDVEAVVEVETDVL